MLTKEASVSVPDTISGCPVIRIGDSAFYQKPCTHFQLPSTITSIGSGAFYRCDSLEQISIPATTESIEGNLFFFAQRWKIYIEKENTHYCDVNGVLYNIENYVYAVVFEVGPKESGTGYGACAWNEVSIRAAWQINGHNLGASIANRHQYGSDTFVIFTNSKQKWNISSTLQGEIDAVGKKVLAINKGREFI